MKQLYLATLLMFLSISIMAQDKVIKVWPNGAPNDNGITAPEEKYDGVRVRNVSEAELYVFTPDAEKNTGVAVVVCPGGGYTIEAMDHEGYDIARFLQKKGITGIVLKYRLPNGNHEVPSSDARQAIRIVRANAEVWGVNPNKIGIAGSSAGGHLASTAGTVFDSGNIDSPDKIEQQSCRPDFMLLLYPVITMDEEFTHQGSRENLLGESPSQELVRKYSNEQNVSAETPSTFLVLADDDTSVVPQNSMAFYSKLKKYKVPAELHIFAQGGHGFGIRETGLPSAQWPELFYTWLKARKIVE